MADFCAGYLSGIVGIIVGSPLDIIKTRAQSRLTASPHAWYDRPSSLIKGAAAPILGYGALNAILFYSYNRTLTALNPSSDGAGELVNIPLWDAWVAGAVGGLACFVVSTPTEIIKCRAQVTRDNSWSIAKNLFRQKGLTGFYTGGAVTSLRDSIGYGFYFWAYEGSKQMFPTIPQNDNSWMTAANTLLCGGIAGCVTWASVYPLDVIKTQVQVQSAISSGITQRLLPDSLPARTMGAIECTRLLYAEGGWRVFWNGLSVCLGRAFLVNAVTFFSYEWTMAKLSNL